MSQPKEYLKARLIQELGYRYVGDRALTQVELDNGYENTHTLDLYVDMLLTNE